MVRKRFLEDGELLVVIEGRGRESRRLDTRLWGTSVSGDTEKSRVGYVRVTLEAVWAQWTECWIPHWATLTVLYLEQLITFLIPSFLICKIGFSIQNHAGEYIAQKKSSHVLYWAAIWQRHLYLSLAHV